MVYTWPLEKLINESEGINRKNLLIRMTETLPRYVFLVGYLKNCNFEKIQDCYDWVKEVFGELKRIDLMYSSALWKMGKEIDKGYVYRNRGRLADVKAWEDVQSGMFSFETKEEPPQCTKAFMVIQKSNEKKYVLRITYDPYGLRRMSTIRRLIHITEKYFDVDCLFADSLCLSRDPSSFMGGFMSVGN